MQLEKIAYGGWENCYRMTHREFELIITADVGPRIVHFGLAGGSNVFAQFEEQMGTSGANVWVSYGGHRLWRAPEDAHLTYYPDNVPVQITDKGNWVRLLAPTEDRALVQKEIQIWTEQADKLLLVQRLWNRSAEPMTVAPWGLSVMAPGGVAILPLPPRGEHGLQNLLPTSNIVVWPYTDLSDERLHFGKQYVMLRQDASKGPHKIGAWVPDGWVAYANNDTLFVKTFTVYGGLPYPDLAVNVELFTNQRMLEVETLAPLQTIAPGQYAEMKERWLLHTGVPTPESEADIVANILPLVQREPQPEKRPQDMPGPWCFPPPPPENV